MTVCLIRAAGSTLRSQSIGARHARAPFLFAANLGELWFESAELLQPGSVGYHDRVARSERQLRSGGRCQVN